MEGATRERRAPRRMFSMLATVGLVAGLVGIVAPSAHATFPEKDGRIAFATDPGTGPQVIKTVRRNGTDLQRVVAHALNPDWAPDGSTIVFTRVHGTDTCGSIEISNPDGSGIVDLTGARSGCEHDPSFTPDGRRIVFIRDCDGCHQAIWRMNLKGGGRTRIRRVPSKLGGGDPNVSPDGRTIAFIGAKTDSLQAVYTVRMNGRGLNRITAFSHLGLRLDWSPSGGDIVFTSYQDGPGNTVVIRPDGSGLVQVTHYSGDLGAGGAVYSPDGRWILYRRQNDTTSRYEIYKMRPDGSQRTLVKRLNVRFVNLDWGPRG